MAQNVNPGGFASDKVVAALDALFEPFNRSDAPGLVVGVAIDERLAYRRGLGLASIASRVANTPATRMRIGSTSKHFTSLAALLLAEEGKLDIDAPLADVLPELPPRLGTPTLRQFMNHTSGLRCYLDVGVLGCGLAAKPSGEALATLLRQSEVNFEPGERMIYCNSGYHLLSLAIERAAGVRFESFLEQRIFRSMGMFDTESVPSDLDMVPGLAALHVPMPDGRYRRGVLPNEDVRGEGGMVSTVADMLRWLAHLRADDKLVGSEATWRQFSMPPRLKKGLEMSYCLGLQRTVYRGIEVVHHAGGVIGGGCQMLTVPSRALDIVILSNSMAVSPAELANKVVDVVLGEQALGPPPRRASVGRRRADGLLGTRYYAQSTGRVVEFCDVKGALGLSAFNGPAVALRNQGDSWVLGIEDVAFGPLSLPASQFAAVEGAPEELHLSESGNVESLRRVQPPAAGAQEDARALVGSYTCPDLGANARIELLAGHLALRIEGAFGRSTLVLQPFGPDVFGWQMLEAPPVRGVLDVTRVEDEIVGLRLNTARTRHLRLHRLAEGSGR